MAEAFPLAKSLRSIGLSSGRVPQQELVRPPTAKNLREPANDRGGGAHEGGAWGRGTRVAMAVETIRVM